ncbi:MAG: tRNA pseudouridine(65) synthase TruC [Gammaproteobacteria bacterium]|nr:tRNA pseudouridine(65) synthase TruC [Gammaproteobacteria bacterium]MBU2478119.1 tRNA pseudouridine(65) synthase TruC [Gammaproteobacteria bacterium]
MNHTTACLVIPPLTILYRDTWLIAIAKPSGLLVHRSLIDKHETRFALQMLRDQIGQRVYPVHRLDKPTSGVLLFTLDEESARCMGEQFEHNAVLKRYLAVVRGYTSDEGTIDYALREEQDRLTDGRARQNKPSQPAITDYQRLATLEIPVSDGRHPTSRYSLLTIQPRTGRKHQIRRHMKHIFHPIIGDTTHGDGRHNRLFLEQLNCRRLLLAAQELHFTHPYSGARISIRSPLDEQFQRVLEAFEWQAGDMEDDADSRTQTTQ